MLPPAAIFLLIAITASASPAGAVAAPLPGTPLEAAAGVPGNGRAWELVTAEEPVGAFLGRELNNTGFLAPSGNRIIYTDLGKLPDAPEQEYIFQMVSSTRGPSGWATATPRRPDVRDEPFIEAVDLDLGEGIMRGTAAPGQFGLLKVGLDGSATTIVTAKPEPELIGASEDLRRTYFSSSAHLVPADATRTEGSSIYEAGPAGIRFVDLDDEGQPISTCGSERAAAPNGAVSRDGRRIYFATHPGCAGPVRIYLGEAGSPAVDVSASRCDLADCGPEAEVQLAAVDPSGSVAVLRTTERLTDEDTDSRASLYRYDAGTGALTLLTPSSSEIASIGRVWVAEDGSRVFFLGRVEGQLVERLYGVDAGGLRKLPGTFSEGSYTNEAQLSADGTVLALSTTAPLLPEDTDGALDIYRYDLAAEELTLLTPGSGGRPAGFPAPEESMVLVEPADRPFRAITPDGSRIFFTSSEPLVSQDRNAVDDVYEWHDGALSLVSSGAAESGGSFFDGVTADGATAFFNTADTLLPRDRDGGARDIYAARIGGGFPEPAAPSPGCEGEACRAPVTQPGPRPAARSAAPLKRLQVAKPGAAARRRIAATGWIELLVEAPVRGRLSAVAKARIGGRARAVAKTAVKVTSPGPLQLRMRLSRQARARLAGGEKLRLRLRLGMRGAPPTAVAIELGGGR
jgi:hypothetical protein